MDTADTELPSDLGHDSNLLGLVCLNVTAAREEWTSLTRSYGGRKARSIVQRESDLRLTCMPRACPCLARQPILLETEVEEGLYGPDPVADVRLDHVTMASLSPFSLSTQPDCV